MIADVDHDRAAAVAADIPGAAVTQDAHAVIASDEVDAVLVASSDATHAEYVHACLEQRKPVLCEKPLAPTAAECAAIVAAEDAIVGDGAPLVSVGFMRRFDPGYVELKGLVDDGTLGVPVMVHSVGRGVSAPAGSDELSITGSAIHDLDIVPWLLTSPVVEVSWQAPRQSPEVTDRQDPQFILLRTADGVLATVDIFLNARYGYDTRCEIVGSLSSASLTEPHRVVRDAGLSHGHGYGGDWRPRFADSYRLQNRAWVESLVQGTPTPLATARDGLQAALVADAVIASMHSGGGYVPVPPTRP
jgi:myo-inositol 2-dehydrogenase/D-chiro-inositol 1-dehydrogenase